MSRNQFFTVDIEYKEEKPNLRVHVSLPAPVNSPVMGSHVASKESLPDLSWYVKAQVHVTTAFTLYGAGVTV